MELNNTVLIKREKRMYAHDKLFNCPITQIMGFTINVKNPELIDNLIHCLFNFKISIKNQYYLVIQMILWSKLNNCKTFLIKS